MIESTDRLVKDYGKRYSAGTIIFSEGDEGTDLFIIAEGEVEISKRVNGKKQLITTLCEGDFFGEMALISEAERTATATATANSEIIVLDKHTFNESIIRDASILYLLLKKICQRLKNTTDELVKRM